MQALRSDSAADGQALGETRKQLKEETLLRLVRFRIRVENLTVRNLDIDNFLFSLRFIQNIFRDNVSQVFVTTLK